jgi:hypothetical protein
MCQDEYLALIGRIEYDAALTKAEVEASDRIRRLRRETKDLS